jgi:hypothetical protein
MCSARGHCAHGSQQCFRLGVLPHVAGGSRAKDARHPRFVDRRGQGDDPALRRSLQDQACRPDAVHPAGQQQVLQDDVRPPAVDVLEQFLAARGDADDLQIGKRFEVRFQAARDDAMIVNEGDGDGAHGDILRRRRR